MKLLICGTGKIARELLKRLGEGWRVTLIDKDEKELSRAKGLFPNVDEALHEDASSPVVLDGAGVGSFDYVLAMTGNDDANLAVGKYANEKGSGHVLALVHEAEDQKRFEEAGVRTILASTLVGQRMYYYLQDPRVRVTPLGAGATTLIEISASDHMRVVGKRASYFSAPNRRLVSIVREGRVLFPEPDTVIRAEDKLIIFGSEDTFEPVCDLLECGVPHFPLAYGPGLLIALPTNEDAAQAVLNESLFLIQNTHVKSATLLCSSDKCDSWRKSVLEWPQDVSVMPMEEGANILGRLGKVTEEGAFGMAVVPSVEGSFLKSLFGSSFTEALRQFDRPILVVKGTAPYGRLLVPFNASAESELALEVAVDLGRQLGAEVSVVIVEEPGFITGDERGEWLEEVKGKLEELGHIHKMRFKQMVRKGNPVSEVVKISEESDLIIAGSSRTGKGLLSPNVAEHLARKSKCSTLLVS